jgi:hypothetical protein
MNGDGELFYGPWLIQVFSGQVLNKQRYSVSGSDNADGGHPAVVGGTLAVSGARWVLNLEWLDHAIYRSSRIARSASYDVQRGLLVTLAANAAGIGDDAYNDLVLVCQSQDPALNPNPPAGNPYDFSFPESYIVHTPSPG